MRKYLQRKAARSGTRDCPICKNKKLLVLHHIHGREVDDWDGDWNRAWICATCHDETHSGRLEIDGWVSTTGGLELVYRRIC